MNAAKNQIDVRFMVNFQQGREVKRRQFYWIGILQSASWREMMMRELNPVVRANHDSAKNGPCGSWLDRRLYGSCRRRQAARRRRRGTSQGRRLLPHPRGD